MTPQERCMERLKRSVGKTLSSDGWRWGVNEFFTLSRYRVGEHSVLVHFSNKFTRLCATLWTEEYGIPNAEKEFRGDTALEECLQWVSEKVIEITDLVARRTASFRTGQMLYERALRGQ